jgi:hypothetical protein
MSIIPMEQQHLAGNPVERIEYEIAQGNAVSGEELLAAIEQSGPRQLDDRLRDVIRKFSIPAVKRRGRPSNCTGHEDFALAEVDNRYPGLLLEYEEKAQQARQCAAAKGDVPAIAEPTPSELAYTEILQTMKADFPNISWRALQNKHSAWKNGHFDSADNHTGSEDFDAEIERQFPEPQDS